MDNIITFFSFIEIRRCVNDVIYIQGGNVSLKTSDVFASNKSLCVLEFRSRPGTHLVLTLNFVPYGGHLRDCSHDEYVHVGNDMTRINKNSITSYRFCGKTVNEEIISRGNFLWVVIKSSKTPEIFHVDVSSSLKTVCNIMEFQCSPLQCVGLDKVCDGSRDCNNARDEFCSNDRLKESECFLCQDGQCINPRIPRYSLRYGQDLWYLCDDVRHCRDGTDERKDICYRIKGKRSATISCVPMESGSSTPVLMWNNIVCDGERDCFHGDDEAPEKCLKDVETGDFAVDTAAVVFVAVFLLAILSTVAYIVYRVTRKKRMRHRDTVSETVDSGETTHLQSDEESSVFDRAGLKQTTL